MHEANLSRFGPETFGNEGSDRTYSTTFKAVEGAAKLVLQSDGDPNALIKINGANVEIPPELTDFGEVAIALNLKEDNHIEISTDAILTVRVTQITQADLGLLRQGYFGLNTSDMERQRAFYETLGFKGEIYPAGPETSTTFARSLGFEDDYLIHVSLHSLQDPPPMPFVDTVQFRGASYREEQPYAKLNHIGMTYATYSTTNLDGDYAHLKSHGIEFLSAPTEAPNGERFVFFKDQDGAFLKLIATDGEHSDPGPNLVRLVNTNMNVTDLERSREFYRLLGFTESKVDTQAGDGEFAKAYGFEHPIAFQGVDVSLGDGTDGATIQLRQWSSPFDDSPAYPPPVNHLGIDRINFYVKDLTAVVKKMNELGFKQLGRIGGAPEIGIVFFFDPDGIKVQFAGPNTP